MLCVKRNCKSSPKAQKNLHVSSKNRLFMSNLPFLFPLFSYDGNTKRDKNKQNNTYIGITLIKAFLWTGLMNTGIKYSIKVHVLVLVLMVFITINDPSNRCDIFKSNPNLCFIMCIFIPPHYKFKKRMIFVAGGE